MGMETPASTYGHNSTLSAPTAFSLLPSSSHQHHFSYPLSPSTSQLFAINLMARHTDTSLLGPLAVGFEDSQKDQVVRSFRGFLHEEWWTMGRIFRRWEINTRLELWKDVEKRVRLPTSLAATHLLPGGQLYQDIS